MKKVRPKNIFGTLLTACVLTAIYITLTERLSLVNVIVGFAISIIALLLTRWLLQGEKYSESFTINGYYAVYVFYLFFIILKSAVVSLGYIFSKNVGVSLIRYTTKLKSDNLKNMLANAITLTPGTVTADLSGDEISVMKLCVRCKLDQTTGFARIERVLAHMDREASP